MSGAIQAVVGAVEIVVGVVLDIYGIPFGNALIMAGVSQLMGYAISLLASQHRPPLVPIGAAYAGTLESRTLLYGTMRVSGMYTTPPLTRGPNNDYLEIALTIAGRPISGYGDVYFNQIRIANGDIGPVTGSLTDGAVTATITNNGFNTWAWIRRYTGLQTAADFIMNQSFAAWDSNHIGRGIAWLVCSLKYSQTVYLTGAPQVSVIAQGHPVYDPRLDTRADITFTQNNTNVSVAASTQPVALGLSITKTSATSAYDAQSYSTETPSGAFVRWYPGTVNGGTQGNAVTGLSASPAAAGYANIDHGFNTWIDASGGKHLYIYELGVQVTDLGYWDSLTCLEIVYDGTNVYYIVDDVVWRTKADAGKSFHFKTALYYQGEAINNLEVGSGGVNCWGYSNNPALCLRDYLRTALGLREPRWRIDDTLSSAAANICDQTVSVPIPVLSGITSWTNGSAAVGGIGSAFLRDLNNGGFQQVSGNFYPTPYPATTLYVLAPNGSMLALASVQSDTQFTLAAAYTGPTAVAQTTQWNTSTSTQTTQKRYTCSTRLDCSARFEDNIAQLARAMLGQCLYSAGKWRMYAGAWSGTTFALTEKDLVGGVSMQCSTPRQTLFNAVRGNFMNPSRNYSPDEFPPVLNPAYSIADGETIFTETNFPCCTDIFEAQRNAFKVLAISRDQQVATMQCGMSAYTIKVWDTGTVTLAELGWVAQTVRCIAWRFTPKGVIELQVQVAYAADWQDPTPASYVVKGANSQGVALLMVPYPPTSLTAIPVQGGIVFDALLPAQFIPGSQVQLWESAANNFAGATLLLTSATTHFVLQKFDTVSRFYWVQVITPHGEVSGSYPAATAGVAAAALQSQSQLWMPWVTMGGAAASDAVAEKQSGAANTWDSAVYSLFGYPSAHIAAKWKSLSDFEMIGFTSQSVPNTPSYTALNFALYNNGGTYIIYESGTNVGSFGAVALTDVPCVTWDGSNVRYYTTNPATGASPIRTVAYSGGTLNGMVCFYDIGAMVDTLKFGPTVNLDSIDTTQMGLNAATAVASVAQSFAGGTNGSGSSSPLLIGTGVSFTPQVSCTVELTLSCDIASDGGPDSAVYFYGGISGLSPQTQLLWQGSGATRGMVTGTVQIAVVGGTTYTAGLYSVNGPGAAGIKCYGYTLSVDIMKR